MNQADMDSDLDPCGTTARMWARGAPGSFQGHFHVPKVESQGKVYEKHQDCGTITRSHLKGKGRTGRHAIKAGFEQIWGVYPLVVVRT